MRPRSPEVIKNLQELDPSKWLDSPYLRQVDEESLLTLLQRKPDGFKTLLNSSYSFIRDIVLRRDILITILKIKPHYIKLIPVKHLSERLFSIVNQAIEKDTDELSKKLLIDALAVAKQELLDYKDAQNMEIKENTSPSSSTQQDIKTPSDTGHETLPNNTPSPSDELEKPNEVSTEPEVNEESTEEHKEPIKEPVVEIECEKESVSTKENNDNNNFTDNSSLEPTIQKAFMDASLYDFTKSLEKAIIHQMNNCIINESGIQLQVEEIKNKSIESIENSNQAVKDTANNLIDALTTRYNQQKEIIEKANNFFDKKGLIQNITIIAVFVNLLLLFFIFITLLLRG